MHNKPFCIKRLLVGVLAIFIISFLSSSCKTTNEIRLLNDLPDSPRIVLPYTKMPDVVIQPDDILEIKVSGSNETTAKEINALGGSLNLSPSSSAANYLVDKDGNVELYKLGKIKVAGYSTDSARSKIVKLIDERLLKNANVFVRFINFRYTMLGDVKTPGSYTTLNDKVTILEALGYSGDLLPTANKSKVRIIRDSSGYKEIGLINLNQKSLFTSPYYFLKRNDVVVVDADVKKKKTTETLTRVSTIFSLVSTFVTLFFLIFKK